MDQLTRCFLSAREDLLRYLTPRAGRVVAEDVVQDTWLRLHERSNPGSWREPRAVFFTTAANLATDTYRRGASADKFFSREAIYAEAACTRPDPEAQADTAGRLERLAAALEGLPRPCRRAFLLNRLEGLSHAQIASRLGVSTKTIQRYVERALRVCVAVPE
jgi:RNA polymerase sigma factor (sigma-70 family)